MTFKHRDFASVSWCHLLQMISARLDYKTPQCRLKWAKTIHSSVLFNMSFQNRCAQLVAIAKSMFFHRNVLWHPSLSL